MSRVNSVATADCRSPMALSGSMSKDRGVAISLFSGAGGLDLGAEAAGFAVHAAVECNQNAADTMEKNFHHLRRPVIRRSILDVPSDEIVKAAGLTRGKRPELLIGGPPCTPFSKSGFWLDWKRAGLDPDASLLQAYTRVLAETRPRYFVLENVYALTYNNRASRPAFERLLCEIDKAGYHYSYEVLNAADYGVAQARPRLFIVGSPKDETKPRLPKPTHGGSWERRRTGNDAIPHVTAAEALSGIITEPEENEEVAGRYGHLLPDIPPGSNYLHYTVEHGHPNPLFKWRSRYWSFLLKLSPEKPSPTIQAQPGPYVGPFHWDNRRLRIPEIKRLFTFPDDFHLVGSRSSIQAQLGNAVPALLSMKVIKVMAGEDD